MCMCLSVCLWVSLLVCVGGCASSDAIAWHFLPFVRWMTALNFSPSLAAWLSGWDVGIWLAHFPRPMPDICLTGDHFVGKVSAVGQATRPTKPSSVRGRYMGSNTWITGMETIIRQTRATYGCLVPDESPWVRTWTALHINCIRLLCLWHKSDTAAAICGLWSYTNVICLCICMGVDPVVKVGEFRGKFPLCPKQMTFNVVERQFWSFRQAFCHASSQVTHVTGSFCWNFDDQHS